MPRPKPPEEPAKTDPPSELPKGKEPADDAGTPPKVDEPAGKKPKAKAVKAPDDDAGEPPKVKPTLKFKAPSFGALVDGRGIQGLFFKHEIPNPTKTKDE